jgi:hypothetical protein
MEEAGGFEPPDPEGPAVFKTAAFNHSATPPTRVAQLPMWSAPERQGLAGAGAGIRSAPAMYGRNAGGITTLPSGCR